MFSVYAETGTRTMNKKKNGNEPPIVSNCFKMEKTSFWIQRSCHEDVENMNKTL